MRKRTLLSLMALAPVVSACGFRLRGAPSFPFKTLYVQAPEGSPFTREVLQGQRPLPATLATQVQAIVALHRQLQTACPAASPALPVTPGAHA